MRLVDSSAWVEWLLNSPLSDQINRELPEKSQWLVPSIVQFELAKTVKRLLGQDAAGDVVSLTKKCVVADLTTNIALHAAELAAEHKLATADAIIYATAQVYNADILTCDRHFEDLPHVRYFAKPRH